MPSKEFPMQYLFRPLAKSLRNKYKIDKLLIKKCNKMLLNFNSEAVSVSKPQNLVQWVCIYRVLAKISRFIHWWDTFF